MKFSAGSPGCWCWIWWWCWYWCGAWCWLGELTGTGGCGRVEGCGVVLWRRWRGWGLWGWEVFGRLVGEEVQAVEEWRVVPGMLYSSTLQHHLTACLDYTNLICTSQTMCTDNIMGLEGLIYTGLFWFSIFTPSFQCSAHPLVTCFVGMSFTLVHSSPLWYQAPKPMRHERLDFNSMNVKQQVHIIEKTLTAISPKPCYIS